MSTDNYNKPLIHYNNYYNYYCNYNNTKARLQMWRARSLMAHAHTQKMLEYATKSDISQKGEKSGRENNQS